MPVKKIIVRLTDLRFYAHIGLFKQEKRVGNEFRVNIEVGYPASIFSSEDLSTSISYADIYEEVKREMSKEWDLLESVALSIQDVILKRWQQITEGKISIEKMSPPIAGIEGRCGIEYQF